MPVKGLFFSLHAHLNGRSNQPRRRRRKPHARHIISAAAAAAVTCLPSSSKSPGSLDGDIVPGVVYEFGPCYKSDLEPLPKEKPSPITKALIALHWVLFAVQSFTGGQSSPLFLSGVKVNEAIKAGQWWRLATPSLLHINIFHMLTNNIALRGLGQIVERKSGSQRLLAVYAIFAVLGNVASYIFCPHPSVGASGAISGLSGATAVCYFRHRHLLEESKDVLKACEEDFTWNTKLSLLIPWIDKWSHLGGFCGGVLAAYLLGPRYVSKTGCLIACTDCPPVPILADPGDDNVLTYCSCTKCLTAEKDAFVKRLVMEENQKRGQCHQASQ